MRCEDEREQCLHYLQTLNTVDFSCFTNAYSKSSILYQVLIFPSQKSAGASVTSANVWLHVVGSLGESGLLRIPRGVIHFSFWAKNLGIITSLRMGHDNAGNNPNWLVEHVVIKNELLVKPTSSPVVVGWAPALMTDQRKDTWWAIRSSSTPPWHLW